VASGGNYPDSNRQHNSYLRDWYDE